MSLAWARRPRNLKYLYSIEDDGVAVFKRDGNGDLERLNSVDIEGMRGCFLSTDYSGNYLFVGGYHDGKVTLVEILPRREREIIWCQAVYTREVFMRCRSLRRFLNSY